MSDKYSNVPQDVPQSNAEKTAHMFMMEGRTNAPTGDYSDSYPMDVLNPQLNATGAVGQFCLKGETKSGPMGDYDYDMKPIRLNPGSVGSQNEIVLKGPQGYPISEHGISHLKK
jgi:hypothetical protein